VAAKWTLSTWVYVILQQWGVHLNEVAAVKDAQDELGILVKDLQDKMAMMMKVVQHNFEEIKSHLLLRQVLSCTFSLGQVTWCCLLLASTGFGQPLLAANVQHMQVSAWQLHFLVCAMGKVVILVPLLRATH